MDGRVEIDEDSDNKGSMWVLDQKLDQSMDEEAGRLRNMYREKVLCNLKFFTLFYVLINFTQMELIKFKQYFSLPIALNLTENNCSNEQYTYISN